MTLPVFLMICLGTNVWAFMAFCIDKVAAVHGNRRISEANLLGLTFVGGVGAITASGLIRHKTRKQPFRRHAEILAVLHVMLVAFTVTLLL